MVTASLNETILDSYWSQLCSLSDALKLKLAAKLTADVAERALDTSNVKVETEGEFTQRIVQKYAGAWKGPETADEIIKNIKADSHSKSEPISFE